MSFPLLNQFGRTRAPFAAPIHQFPFITGLVIASRYNLRRDGCEAVEVENIFLFLFRVPRRIADGIFLEPLNIFVGSKHSELVVAPVGHNFLLWLWF